MKTRTKALLLVMSALLLIVSTVFATMAYLTSQTNKITNTFTVGNVTITMDEAKVDVYGNPLDASDNIVNVSAATRREGNSYKIIPGHTYVKDPTIHIGATSEDCWLFVKLVNPLEGIIASKTITEQMQDNGWTIIDATNNIWAKTSKAIAGVDVKIFEYFTIKGDVALDASYADITVQAYAVQADGFDSAIAAWGAAPFAAWTTP